jgi:hypothetical protein
MLARTTKHELSSFATVKDMDRDGTAELLVGSTPTSDSDGRGRALLVQGTPTRRRGAMELADHSSVFRASETTSNDLGRNVANGGDIDGDGVADALIAAPARGRGTVFAFSGHSPLSAAYDLDATATPITGDSEMFAFPRAIAGGGDLNGDGYHDVLVSADWGATDSDRGQVFLFYGRPGFFDEALTFHDASAVFRGVAYDEAGLSIAIDGDFDGDGYDDVAIGGTGRRLYLVYGGP